MVYFRMHGRLGNWLFQYAAALSLHTEVLAVADDDGVYDTYGRFANFFKGLKVLRKAPEGVERYDEPQFNYTPLPPVSQLDGKMLSGYFQTEKYFDADDLRKRYAIPPEVKTHILAKYGEWLSRPNVTGLSVRRGIDYLIRPECHPWAEKRYYRNAIARLSESSDFVVCSDDIEWCKNWFPRAFPTKNFCFVEGEDVLIQFYIHALCQHNILSNSSFSWWGGWLNENANKRVLAQSNWFGFALGKRETWQDIYFDKVEIVSNRYSISQWIRAHYLHSWRRLKLFLYPVKKWLCGR